MSNPVKIKTDNINFYYGKSHTLKNLSMDIYAQQVTAIIGPSGCGKSTFPKNKMTEDYLTGKFG